MKKSQIKGILKQIKKSKVHKRFDSLLKEFSSRKSKIDVDLISIAIFFQMFKMRESLEDYKQKIDRGKDITLAELFQDLIGYYLRNNLSGNHQVKTENFKRTKGKKGVQPDFLITKNSKNHALLEVSTNLGYKRYLVQEKGYLKRIQKLRKAFNFEIPKKRSFYIIETVSNVDKDFSEKFKKGKMSNILPLFSVSADPQTLRKKIRGKLTPSKIILFAKKNQITSFKEIIKKIKK